MYFVYNNYIDQLMFWYAAIYNFEGHKYGYYYFFFPLLALGSLLQYYIITVTCHVIHYVTSV